MKRVEKNEEIAKEIEHEKKVKVYKSHAKTVIKVTLITMTLVFSFFYYIRFIEPSMLFVKETKIESSKIPKSLSGLKIVHFSDIHYKMTTNEQEIKKLVQKIQELKPDILVFTGDLLDEKIEYKEEDYKFLNEKLEEMEVSMSKYYVKGHTDYFTEKTEQILNDANFISLNNNHDWIYGTNEEKIEIIGFGSSLQNDFDLEQINSISDDSYSITLFHEPDNITELKDKNIDLALAGHSHNNQIHIPILTNLIKVDGAKNYNNNYYQVNQTQLFITAGIGTSNFRYRLFSPPTINLYRLVHKD